MKIQTSVEVKNKPIYMLVYGTSGRGKTSLCKTLPMKRTLILDAENGLAALADQPVINNIALHKDDNGVTLNEEARFKRFLEFIELVKLPATKEKYDWLVIDSLTEVAQNVKRHMDGLHEGFKAWGEYANAMIDILKFFRDLDHYNVLFLALEDRIDDEETGKSTFHPEIGGKKARNFLLPCFDEVYRIIPNPDQDSPVKRVFITQETAKTQAKNRRGGLEPIEPADVGAVVKKIKGEK